MTDTHARASRPALVLSLAAALWGCTATHATAQILRDDFAGQLDPALGWDGDLDAFVVEGERLRLLDARTPAPGVASLYFPAAVRDTACFTLGVELDFSPSASNAATWWLAADRPLTQAGVAGFGVEIGGISGSDDAFVLFHDDGTDRVDILSTAPGSAGGDPVIADLAVCFGESRGWELVAAFPDGTTDARGPNATPAPLAGSFTGITGRYTSSRNGLLFFDAISVGPVFVDTEAPQLVLAEALDARMVRLLADEALDPAAAASPTQYTVAANTVVEVDVAGATVVLRLADDLTSGVPTAVEVAGWRDLAGNTAGALRTTVTFVAPRIVGPFEVVISEIMADPTPAVGLPAVEYVELFNAGTGAVSLDDLRFVRGGDTLALPQNQTLAPGAYLALAGEEVPGDARYVAYPQLPALTNGGATLALVARDGSRVDEVSYTPAWHLGTRDDGGYSLERIDLAQACVVGQRNWTSSDALSGGTPGGANSVAATLPADSLRIVRRAIVDPATLTVDLNRSLGAGALADAFELDFRDVVDVREGERRGSYLLTLDAPLDRGSFDRVALSRGVGTCAPQDLASRRRLVVGIPEAATPGDIELNEVMYDPLAGQGRYVELANTTDRLLSLDALRLARLDSGRVGPLFEPEETVLLPPGGLVALADDRERLLGEFPTADPALAFATDVPTLGAQECLRLFDPVAEEVHWTVCYAEDWHNRAYANTDGVSLERISLAEPPTRGDNWTSAASTSNFGTPTLANSQRAPATPTPPSGTLALVSQTLSPDGDGFEDQLELRYAFGDPETLARFEVFDLAGRPVLTADGDVSPGANGTWRWDGVDDDGAAAAVGTYVLRVSSFSPSRAEEVEHFAFSLLLAR